MDEEELRELTELWGSKNPYEYMAIRHFTPTLNELVETVRILNEKLVSLEEELSFERENY